jgi:hypothetical protein
MCDSLYAYVCDTHTVFNIYWESGCEFFAQSMWVSDAGGCLSLNCVCEKEILPPLEMLSR